MLFTFDRIAARMPRRGRRWGAGIALGVLVLAAGVFWDAGRAAPDQPAATKAPAFANPHGGPELDHGLHLIVRSSHVPVPISSVVRSMADFVEHIRTGTAPAKVDRSSVESIAVEVSDDLVVRSWWIKKCRRY